MISVDEIESVVERVLQKRKETFSLECQICALVKDIKDISKELTDKTFIADEYNRKNRKYSFREAKLVKTGRWDGTDLQFEYFGCNKKNGQFDYNFKNETINYKDILYDMIWQYFKSRGGFDRFNEEKLCNFILDMKDKTTEDIDALRLLRLLMLIKLPKTYSDEYRTALERCVERMFVEENIGIVDNLK